MVDLVGDVEVDVEAVEAEAEDGAVDAVSRLSYDMAALEQGWSSGVRKLKLVEEWVAKRGVARSYWEKVSHSK